MSEVRGAAQQIRGAQAVGRVGQAHQQVREARQQRDEQRAQRREEARQERETRAGQGGVPEVGNALPGDIGDVIVVIAETDMHRHIESIQQFRTDIESCAILPIGLDIGRIHLVANRADRIRPPQHGPVALVVEIVVQIDEMRTQ